MRNLGTHSAVDCELRELESVAKIRVQTLRDRRPILHLPHIPNTAAGADPIALWKGPGDWLLYSLSLGAEAVEDWVAAIPSATPLITTDVTSGSAVLELSGPRALEVLLRDCSLDLEGDGLPAGACAQTVLAQTSVMIHRPAETQDWRIFVERSVARHLWAWLCDTLGPSRQTQL